MNKRFKGALAAAGLGLSVQTGATAYLFRRTMKRSRSKLRWTMKMSGTDWSKYAGFIMKRREFMLGLPHQDVWITSRDHLRLHGLYFPGNSASSENKAVICFHGYSSHGLLDFAGISDYYIRNGYKILMPDARAHGQSQGDYICFGCKERLDALDWIRWLIQTSGPDCQILLHGVSMGGTTVLMSSSLNLPPQVKGIISDCGFTSPKGIFTHVLHKSFHIPSFPTIPMMDGLSRWKAGYGLDDHDAAREVRHARIPILLIHGTKDSFVPEKMCEEICKNCASPVEKLIIPGASHAEAYYIGRESYEKALDRLADAVIKENHA